MDRSANTDAQNQDDVTETINRICEVVGDPRDEFAIEAGRRILQSIEWVET